MKKKIFTALLAIVFVMLLSVNCFAVCTVTVTLTVTSDPNAAVQEVWYDPDNTTQGDAYIPAGCNGDMTFTGCTFQIAAAVANDEIFVVTENADGTEVFTSSPVSVGGISGSVVSTVVVECCD